MYGTAYLWLVSFELPVSIMNKTTEDNMLSSRGKTRNLVPTLLEYIAPLHVFFWVFHGEIGLLSPGKGSCDGVALPNLRCMLGVSVFA